MLKVRTYLVESSFLLPNCMLGNSQVLMKCLFGRFWSNDRLVVIEYVLSHQSHALPLVSQIQSPLFIF